MSDNARDLLELFCLPALAAAMPWRLGTAFCRQRSVERWYDAEAQAALGAARAFLPVANQQDWARRYRQGRLFDHADLFLMQTRGERWFQHWVDVEGRWPEQGPFVVVTFHYGTGFWGIRHLRRSGFAVQAVRRGFDRALFGPAWVRYRYARLRTQVTDRAFGLATLQDDAHSVRKLRQALRQGRCVLGLFDVPVEAGRKAIAADFFGRPARFPRGLLYLARTESVPIVVYTLRTDVESGRKHLRIFPPIRVDDEQRAGREVVRLLETAIHEDPTAWHHWAGVARFFTETDAAAAQSSTESV